MTALGETPVTPSLDRENLLILEFSSDRAVLTYPRNAIILNETRLFIVEEGEPWPEVK
ncbi:hypothetical protein PN462_19000 [Spirulina sp. CS-785/01]|uniref:hypothetical protein n=1 Tax=Spirulina sp. CS-785/01 TaxID=3021716 RepID=UPI00232C4E3E|nr:hypothetical protein [Spirulina sp. CS-785/01]MDB9315210.1 hypothetical protein [Spirulina sp. CS-785/01]